MSAPPPHESNEEPPPPAYQTNEDYSKSKIQRNSLKELIEKYEISQLFSQKLNILSSFKIVFIFDDSGSMNFNLDDSPLNKTNFTATRWNELESFANISIDIANHFCDNEGVDVHFLNRPAARRVRNTQDLAPYFVKKPAGFTPLTRVLRQVLSEADLSERKLLVVIATDGEPTDDRGQSDIAGFKQALQQRTPHQYTTILSCTDQNDTMDYLNNWDRTLPRLDVIDDYRNEKAEILRAQGSSFRFSYGDYIVKSFIGSIDPEMDNLDETGYKSDGQYWWLKIIAVAILIYVFVRMFQ